MIVKFHAWYFSKIPTHSDIRYNRTKVTELYITTCERNDLSVGLVFTTATGGALCKLRTEAEE